MVVVGSLTLQSIESVSLGLNPSSSTSLNVHLRVGRENFTEQRPSLEREREREEHKRSQNG